MRAAFALILCLSSPIIIRAQNEGPARVAGGVILQDTNVRQVIDLWQHYLASHPDSSYDNPYWNSEEKKLYKFFDIAPQTLPLQLYAMMDYWKPTIMSVTTTDGQLYKVRTLFAVEDSGYAFPVAITDVYAQRYTDGWKLRNALVLNTARWTRKRVGHVTFIFPKSHTFNTTLAVKMNALGDSLAQVLKIAPLDVEYYFADTRMELMRAAGLDFQMGEYEGTTPSGKADVDNRILFGGGPGEYYPHELTHIYMTPQLPDIGFLLDEGVATFVGGSRGMTLTALVRRADSLLEQHPLAPDSLFEPVDLDGVTNTLYVTGGLLVQMAYDRWGWKGTMELLRTIHNEASWVVAVSKILGVPKSEFGNAIRREVHRRAHLRVK